jgi:FkbM family methyltransferase
MGTGKGIPRTISRSAYWVREIWGHPANQGARLAAVRRAARWHWRTRGGAPVEALVTVDGRTTILARPGQFSAVWTLYDGVHEWEELQFCLRFLRPGDLFVDVGANVGVFSALVGTRVGGVRTMAIEPFPPVRHDLETNLGLNRFESPVTVVGSAVSEEPGQAVFEVLERDVLNRLAPQGSVGDSHTGIPVDVTTLDDLVDEVPALIKIDVEGSELLVLRGARRLLTASEPKHSPVLLFEHCGHGAQFGISPADVRSFLAELDYHIFLLDGALTSWESDELPTTPNVVAARDIAAVRSRLDSPGGAPAVAPVPVRVSYRAHAAPSR